MKNLTAYATRCEEMLDYIGINYGKVVDFTVNTRAKKRWGQCHKNPDNTFSININSALLADDIEDKGLIETLLHELIHTCKNCFNHKSEWQRIANTVNRAYNLNIKRTNSAEDKGIENYVYNKPEYKYTVSCPCCNYQWHYARMAKIVKNPQNFRCGRCNEKLVRLV